MEKSIQEILNICLDKLKKGIPIDDILKEYPEHRDQLEKILFLAKDLRSVKSPKPSDEGLISCLVKVGEAIQQQKGSLFKSKLTNIFYFPAPVIVKSLVILLIVIFISWGSVNLSATSTPGEFLYPVKIVTEKVKFILTTSPEEKIELRIIFSEERMKELIQQLNKDKNLNPQLLQAMLNEASLALENVTNLPEDKREIYYSKLKYLTQYQKDTLEDIKPKVKLQQRQKLDWAINMCRMRMQKMHQMMERMHKGKRIHHMMDMMR